MVLPVLCMLFMFGSFQPETIKAGVYDNAYAFYQTYGNNMTFQAGSKRQGEIYYATKAKKDEHTGIKYTTIGWKVRVFRNTGALVETLYYKLGGNNMSSIDTCTVNGYEYCLYRVTLDNLKSRLSEEGRNTLNHPDCNIVFDACTTTKLNGVVQGGMTDIGPSWGKVYTTYNGIVNAQDWSSATKETLKSYYNKTVEGLFYEVKVEKGPGIAEVSGAGKYCFGSRVTISAVAQEGFHFTSWSGSGNSSNASYTFTLYNQAMTFQANGAENTYIINFLANGGSGSVSPTRVTYRSEFVTPISGFTKENAAMSGWRLYTTTEQIDYLPGQQIDVSTLVKQMGLQNVDGAQIDFVANWDHGPIIYTKEIFVSLLDAQKGKITEEWLSKRAQAMDGEDGEIPYGRNNQTSFLIEDFQASDYSNFSEEGSREEVFFAIDSAGNRTQKSVQIHVINDEVQPASRRKGWVRFISKKYFWDTDGVLLGEDLGGLAEDSVWRLNEEYRSILEKLFD